MSSMLHRDEQRRPYDNATAYPAADLRNRATAPVVSVLGPRGCVTGLARHLSDSWTVRFPRAFDDVGDDDIVLLAGADLRGVAAARTALPRRTAIVALVDTDAGPDTVAEVLAAGADVCVRAGQPAVLAGHLVACRRRQVAGRWSALGAHSA